MSIEFQCPECNNKIIVSDEMAEKRGKCPRCNGIIKVPRHSQQELILSSEEQGFFRSKRLNQLFEEFLDEHSDRIKRSQIHETTDRSEGVVLEIRTEYGRTQLVALFLIEVDGNSILVAKSAIGLHPEFLNFNDILIDIAFNLPAYPTYVPYIEKRNDGRNEIGLRKATPFEHVDTKVFYNFTIRIADLADALESKHYDNDVN